MEPTTGSPLILSSFWGKPKTYNLYAEEYVIGDSVENYISETLETHMPCKLPSIHMKIFQACGQTNQLPDDDLKWPLSEFCLINLA